jgi:dolichol-phosphate mannosyltransferase
MDIDISVVLPVHNEENSIGLLLSEIALVFETTVRRPYEIIVVDDSSDDASVAVIEKFADGRCIDRPGESRSFLANFELLSQPVRAGQARALMRGMEAARGGVIVTMDADMQHDPADIFRFLEAMEKFDMVCGVRKSRSDGRARLVCSKIANAFRNLITGDSIADSGCTFRALRRECLPAFAGTDGRLFGCEFFFHPLFARRKGFCVGEIDINHRPRRGGRSNYQLMRGRFLRGMAACFRARKLLAKR